MKPFGHRAANRYSAHAASVAKRRLNPRRLLGPAVDDTMTSRLAVRRDGLPADTDRTLAFYLGNTPAATG
jgi:hypothetical protein